MSFRRPILFAPDGPTLIDWAIVVFAMIAFVVLISSVMLR